MNIQIVLVQLELKLIQIRYIQCRYIQFCLKSDTLVLLTYLVYNTVVRLCQFFCCGRKANLVQIFLLNPNFLLVHRNKLSVSVYLFLAFYGSTTIQSPLFLKNIENFLWFPKQYLLGFFTLEKQIANIPDRGFLFLHSTLLLYSFSPYSQTERLTESHIHLLCMGWRNLFSCCAVVSVFCSGGK